jgi:UDP-glucose-4-epimerase GalE
MTRARDSILVTGGAGFVGSHFARAAAEAGSRVVVLDDLSGGTPAKLPPPIEVVQGDIADRALVARLLDEHGITSVAHFAGKICVGESVEHPALYFDRNVVRTLALLDAVRGRVHAFLFSSSAAVYGIPDTTPIPETARTAPINPYGTTKLVIEQALAAYDAPYGLRWAALRYFNAAGAHPDGTLVELHEPETHLIPLALDAGLGRRAPLVVFGDDYPTPDGTCIRDYVHVCDLATAHLSALDALDGGTSLGAINLGSGQAITVRQVLDEAARVLGRPVPHSIGARRAGDPATLLASNARAGELLAWRPQRSDLATILEDALRGRR